MPVDVGICQKETEQVTLQFVTFPKWTTRQPIEMIIGEDSTGSMEAVSVPFPASVPVQAVGSPDQPPRFFRLKLSQQ